jgi:hypothetical protein
MEKTERKRQGETVRKEEKYRKGRKKEGRKRKRKIERNG